MLETNPPAPDSCSVTYFPEGQTPVRLAPGEEGGGMRFEVGGLPMGQTRTIQIALGGKRSAVAPA